MGRYVSDRSSCVVVGDRGACVSRARDRFVKPSLPLLPVTDTPTVSGIVAVSHKGRSYTGVPCIMPEAAQAVTGAIETYLQLGYIHKLP